MACMEWHCVECSWSEMSNNRHSKCPKCGGRVVGMFDEAPEEVNNNDDES